MATDRSRTFSLLRALSAGVVTLSACSSAVPAQSATGDKGTSPSDISHFLPLEDGTVLSYETESGTTKERGVIVLQISRPRPGLVEMNDGGHIQRIELDPDGARHATGGHWLKTPLEKGACWTGRTGQTCITNIALSITVPAGKFAGCLETVERSPKQASTVTSVFCPSVGMVSLTAEGTLDGEVTVERARLKSYGPRTDLLQP